MRPLFHSHLQCDFFPILINTQNPAGLHGCKFVLAPVQAAGLSKQPLLHSKCRTKMSLAVIIHPLRLLQPLQF